MRFYIRVGDDFTPLESVNRIQGNLLHAGNTGKNKYISQHTPKDTELIEITGGKAKYYKGEILFADMVNGFDVLLREGKK